MRRLSFATVLIIMFGGVGLFYQARPSQADNEKPVKVDAKCPKDNNEKFTITVDPLIATVTQGQGVSWNLTTDNKKNEYIEVTAKNREDWLYEVTSEKKKSQVVMTNMKPGASGKE